MKTKFDENVLDYWKIPNENFILKIEKDDGLDDGCDIENILPAQFGTFILGNSKRIMNNFITEITVFTITTYTMELPTVYIMKGNNGMFWKEPS